MRCGELCDGVEVSPEDVRLAREAGLKAIVSSKGGDVKLIEFTNHEKPAFAERIHPGVKWAAKVKVRNRGEERIALEAVREGASYLVVECPNWKVIPLENLIAEVHGSPVKLIAAVGSLQEAEVALETLELGVDGILLEIRSQQDLEASVETVKPWKVDIPLVEATVKAVMPLGKGARACVDTCDILNSGEGCLVGSQSSGLFLVEAEVYDTPHVDPRPFRVNAGPVSSYILTLGSKTRYLSELKAGDKILTVDRDGNAKSSIVGRIKIEIRPMLMVEAEHDGASFKVILQNAETIRLVTSEDSKSVSELKPGDKVLIHREEGGRHFGISVPGEMIVEG